MGRHAYMILAHQQWELLMILLRSLDDERNDIYVHVDKKAKDVPFENLREAVKTSKLVFVNRVPVYRGSFSFFEAELILLKAALESGEYSYLHLLSGQDLPLKNQDCIHRFFAKNEGRNFIDVITPDHMKKDWYERVSLYQPCSRFTLCKPLIAIPAKCIRRVFLIIQRRIGVNRLKPYEERGLILCFGSNWFSITEPFADYIVKKESLIRKVFQNGTFAPEEMIPQTLIWSSKFRETAYNSEELDGNLQRANLRAVFWNGSVSPETITLSHLGKAKKTANLFARKFDIKKNPEAVEAACNDLEIQPISSPTNTT